MSKNLNSESNDSSLDTDDVVSETETGCIYNELIDKINLPRVKQRYDRSSVFAQYTIFAKNRENLQQLLKQAGIPTAIHYPIPLNKQPAYESLCCKECTPIANKVSKEVLSLPIGADISHNQIKKIVSYLP